MKQVISSEKLPIKLWLDDIELGALEQAKNLANLDFAYKHIAIMPDSHQGYGMPIGGVMALIGKIIPNAVGVDIGCGMCAVKTSLTEIDTDTLKKIMGEIRQAIPVGFKKHKELQDGKLMPEWKEEEMLGKDFKKSIVEDNYRNALFSLGTLGGGNHFIEIQKGSEGHIWIMIHSGSRNLGYKIADHYAKVAYDLNKKWNSKTHLPKNYKDSLAFLPTDTEEAEAYIREMHYAVEFALANRKLMMQRVMEIFTNQEENCCDIKFDRIINIAHNYADLEHHFGKDVWIHRKGATLAREGTIGIIPGSQGTKSYIVKGLGNQESFMSCSHGAGRKMGRKEAQRTLNLEEEQKKLNDQGIIHSVRSANDLDEAPGSYKDIDVVMANQKDLVEVLVELSPLAVIKG